MNYNDLFPGNSGVRITVHPEFTIVAECEKRIGLRDTSDLVVVESALDEIEFRAIVHESLKKSSGRPLNQDPPRVPEETRDGRPTAALIVAKRLGLQLSEAFQVRTLLVAAGRLRPVEVIENRPLDDPEKSTTSVKRQVQTESLKAVVDQAWASYQQLLSEC